MLLSAFRGREAEATSLIGPTIAGATAGGQGIGAQFAEWVAAVLWNGFARYEDALAAARNATDDEPDLFLAPWALPELVEAAVKTRAPKLGDRARSSDWRGRRRRQAPTGRSGSRHAAALARDGGAAVQLYSEAIDRLSRTHLRPELARTHLLYGEWLRRGGSTSTRASSSVQPPDMLAAIGDGRVRRARPSASCLATGERSAKAKPTETRGQLTPQELQIATPSPGTAFSNPEIGAQLFLSAPTVEWHLRKVFLKLGISSRRQLRASLAAHEGRRRRLGCLASLRPPAERVDSVGVPPRVAGHGAALDLPRIASAFALTSSYDQRSNAHSMAPRSRSRKSGLTSRSKLTGTIRHDSSPPFDRCLRPQSLHLSPRVGSRRAPGSRRRRRLRGLQAARALRRAPSRSRSSTAGTSICSSP